MDLVLETPRLQLRPIGPDDLEVLHRLWTDPDVRRFLWDDIVIPVDRVVTEIDRSIASFYIDKFGLWAVSQRDDADVIGFCGLRRFGGGTDVELLYGLYPRYWHQGLATEASRAVLHYGFAQFALERIYAGSDPPNAASQQVMQRLGMTYSKRLKINGLDADYFAITRTEFSADVRNALGT
jgi:ribosomal-protein-alanine N-acetyltransferase